MLVCSRAQDRFRRVGVSQEGEARVDIGEEGRVEVPDVRVCRRVRGAREGWTDGVLALT